MHSHRLHRKLRMFLLNMDLLTFSKTNIGNKTRKIYINVLKLQANCYFLIRTTMENCQFNSIPLMNIKDKLWHFCFISTEECLTDLQWQQTRVICISTVFLNRCENTTLYVGETMRYGKPVLNIYCVSFFVLSLFSINLLHTYV